MNNTEFKTMVGKAIKALVAQGVPCKTSEGACLYSKENHCCIVGHMMPNDKVRQDADLYPQSGINFLAKDEFEWALQFTEGQIKVLCELQDLHDGSNDTNLKESIKTMEEIYHGL